MADDEGRTTNAERRRRAMKHLFVSYTNADVQWAEWIAWTLEQEGYTTTIQAWDFRPGANFVLEMQRALQECERVIAVLSPRYLASKFAAEEWSAAIASDPTGDKLLPIRIEPCDNEGLLRARVYIDLVGTDGATARQRLLAGVKRERAKPPTPPPFPTPAPRRFPGTPPAIWNLPFERNLHFTGREDELRQLHDALAACQAAAPSGIDASSERLSVETLRRSVSTERLNETLHRSVSTERLKPQTIHGLGGVGKTHLAVEYAYRFAADYDLVWWVRADAPLSIATDLALLAAPLQLPQRDERDQRVVVQAVLDYLRRHDGADKPRPYLLIFDNAEEPRDLRPFLPQGRGSVLITSRNPNWGALAHPLEVRTLPRDKAIEFLLARAGRQGEGAGELADALGCLPLALEQAGAYIEASGIAFADYLARWRAHHRELLQHPPATDYPATVATTWDISFQAVAAQSPDSVTLMNLLAFFAPEPIPRDLFIAREGRGAIKLRPHEWRDEMELDNAVIPLRRYSLIQACAETLAMHRLVQMIVRDRLDDGERKTLAHAALHAVNDAFPGDEILTSIESWATCARLAVHARAVTEEAERLGIAPEATARLLNQLGLYLEARAEFADARAYFERAISRYETALGTNHPHVATAVNNLGSVLRDLGDLAGARTCFERVVKIFEDNALERHPNYAGAVNNLGSVLRDLGDLAGARACYERVVKIFEDNLGSNHPNAATAVNNLGGVLRDLGDLAGARACFERALLIDEATFGPHHPNVARDVNNLGSVLRDLGDLAGARAYLERALQIDEATFGPHHPSVATAVNNLGNVLRDLGDLAGARTCFERVVKIFEDNLGSNHPNVATAVNNLGSVLQDLGDLAGARTCFERVVKIFEDNALERHPNYAGAVNNLGSVLRDLGDLAGARTCFERVVKIFEDNLGSNHPNVATAVNNLGSVLQDLGDLAGARVCYERALNILTQFLPADHPHIKIVRRNLEGMK
jgi:tetratricopeptide (TPR) repeat protein